MTPTQIDDGGPAFPRAGQVAFDSDGRPLDPCGGFGWTSAPVNGMSIRDWFAGQALAGHLAAISDPKIIEAIESFGDTAFQLTAKSAYAYADAMLAARKEGA